MKCPRCMGAMVRECFQDLKDDTGKLYFFGFRCMTCGEILDPVILNNRTNPNPLRKGGNKVLKSAFFGK